jgi:hypothetical protein
MIGSLVFRLGNQGRARGGTLTFWIASMGKLWCRLAAAQVRGKDDQRFRRTPTGVTTELPDVTHRALFVA